MAAVNGRDFASLPQFPPPASVRDPELTIRVASCPLCGETNVLTLSHLAWITNKQGIKTLNVTKLVDGLLITCEEARVISALIPRIPKADPDQEPAREQGPTE